MRKEDLAYEVIVHLREGGYRLATAESCTGGLLSGVLTGVPGASSVFMCGYVTYSDRSKCEMLGIDVGLIGEYGVVSEEVACAMARGALLSSVGSGVCVALSITGIAGPGGATERKPVGLVCMGLALGESLQSWCFSFKGDRTGIREASVMQALRILLNLPV